MESSTFPSPSRNFYSRPCGRGDLEQEGVTMEMKIISTHAPAGGATSLACSWSMSIILFLLTPLREGRLGIVVIVILSFNLISTHAPAGGATGSLDKWDFRSRNFYSRPCGRGDGSLPGALPTGGTFLLTPLREGRPQKPSAYIRLGIFLLTPLREGRRSRTGAEAGREDFYSRPCGRGD